jgi:ribonuclease VapC
LKVFDASALLAYLQGEAGSDEVEAGLQGEAACGAANWSEIAQKLRAHGRDWPLSRALLLASGLRVEAVTRDDAERAAQLWRAGSGLSLGDRLCLALAERLDAEAWTADQAWGSAGRVRQIR